jgi:non-ribosomal peptide synthetase component E (peptide arylation enzyme)
MMKWQLYLNLDFLFGPRVLLTKAESDVHREIAYQKRAIFQVGGPRLSRDRAERLRTSFNINIKKIVQMVEKRSK